MGSRSRKRSLTPAKRSQQRSLTPAKKSRKRSLPPAKRSRKRILRERPKRAYKVKSKGEEFIGHIEGFDEENFAYVNSGNRSWILREKYFVGDKFEDLRSGDAIGFFADREGGSIKKAWLEKRHSKMFREGTT